MSDFLGLELPCECLELNSLLTQQVLLPQAIFPGSIFVPSEKEYCQVVESGELEVWTLVLPVVHAGAEPVLAMCPLSAKAASA